MIFFPLLEVILLQGLVLLAFGLAGGWAAERLGGPRLVGGVLAGVLLGPTVLGQLGPDVHRYLFIGGYEEHQNLEEFDAERAADRQTLESIDVTPTALEEFDREASTERGSLEAEVRFAEVRHSILSMGIVIPAVIFILTTAGVTTPVRRLRPELSGAAATALMGLLISAALAVAVGSMLLRSDWLEPEGTEPTRWLIGMMIGCAAAPLPVASHLLRHLRESGGTAPSRTITCYTALVNGLIIFTSLAIIMSLTEFRFTNPWSPFKNAAATGPGITAALDNAATMGQTLIVTLSTVTFVAAALIFVPLMDRIAERWIPRPGGDARTAARLVALGLVAAIFAGLELLDLNFGTLALFALLIGVMAGSSAHARPHRSGEVLTYLMSGVLFAFVGSRLDLIADFDWLLVLVVLIAFGDAKALGVMLAARWFGRRGWREGLKMGMAIAAGGTVPLVVALVLRMSGIIDGPLFTALVIAAVVTALVGGPATRMVDEMGEA